MYIYILKFDFASKKVKSAIKTTIRYKHTLPKSITFAEILIL